MIDRDAHHFRKGFDAKLRLDLRARIGDHPRGELLAAIVGVGAEQVGR